MTLSEISQTLFDSTYMQFKNIQSNHGDVNQKSGCLFSDREEVWSNGVVWEDIKKFSGVINMFYILFSPDGCIQLSKLSQLNAYNQGFIEIAFILYINILFSLSKRRKS